MKRDENVGPIMLINRITEIPVGADLSAFRGFRDIPLILLNIIITPVLGDDSLSWL
jgi:hypothetical protein